MKYNIHTEKVNIDNKIREYLISKLNKLNKYIKRAEVVNARILIKIKGHEHIIEVTIPIKNIVLRAEEVHPDLYASIDLVVDKLERQIRKNKGRILTSKLSRNKFFDFNDNNIDEDTSKIVKRKTLETKPMSEEDAILEMNLLGHDFFVFKDRDTNSCCVLYKRKDGNYGIIET